MLKKVNALVLGLAVLLAFACEKNNNPEVTPNVSNNQNAPKCVATSWQAVATNPAISGQYEYDNQSRIIKAKYYTDIYWTYQLEIQYNNAGAIQEIIGRNVATNAVLERIIYDYNPGGQLIKRTYYTTNFAGQYGLTNWNTYEYNAANKLNKINHYQPADPNVAVAFSTITYPGPDQVTMEIYSFTNSSPFLGHRYENTYDSRKKPQPFVGIRPTDDFDLLSEGNLTIEKHTTYSGSDSTTVIKNFTYQYNENGFPTEKNISWNGNAPALTEIFNYTCQ